MPDDAGDPPPPVSAPGPPLGSDPDLLSASAPGPAAASTPDPAAAASPGAPPAAEASPGLSLREIMAYGSTIVGLMCLIKVYGVARYSTTTSAALVFTAPAEIMLGTLAIYVYPTMAILAYGLGWFVAVGRRVVHPALWPLILGICTVTGLVTPLEYHVVGLQVVLCSTLLELLVPRLVRLLAPRVAFLRRGSSVSLRGHAILYVGGPVLLYGFFTTLDSPWGAPVVFILREPVVVQTQVIGDALGSQSPTSIHMPDEPLVAYPLEESWDAYTVLVADTRYVIHLEKSNVSRRLLCHERQHQLASSDPLFFRLLDKKYDSPNTYCDTLVGSLGPLWDARKEPHGGGAEASTTSGHAATGESSGAGEAGSAASGHGESSGAGEAGSAASGHGES